MGKRKDRRDESDNIGQKGRKEGRMGQKRREQERIRKS
jgi:hypothetical protein